MDYVANSMQLALLLEASATPKPGNIHRCADFQKTRYEHFLASAVAVSPAFRLAAKKGMATAEGRIQLSQIKLGGIIRKAVEDVGEWQTGGNTYLGAIILLAPMAAAAGVVLAKEDTFPVASLRHHMMRIVEATTPQDAVEVYDAIRIASPGGLGKVPKLDVNDPASKRIIMAEKKTLYQIFRDAAAYDSICHEWTNSYPLTFDTGYPYFHEQLRENRDLNTATVHTFLKILAEKPDTLIARKTSRERAAQVSKKAEQILAAGGLTGLASRKQLEAFDLQLRDKSNRLNPGTTADIVSAVLAASILNSYKP